MADEKLIKKMQQLAQLDIDATFAYDQALKNIDDVSIHERIAEFRDDHLKHISDLNRLIAQYGGEPAERTKDFKGYLIEGFTSLRSITGVLGALRAMHTNEVITNKNYKQAVEDNADTPAHVQQVISANYLDEQRHITYIDNTITRLKNASTKTQQHGISP